ncbi:hypothetical protein ACIRPU_40830 [Streptomyces sp. NPDC102259]|uniref:hypothetical protein n=1 Tax=Streptomyces sp. NPDC102259 TaxID=3366148 RepID=UPI00382C5A72
MTEAWAAIIAAIAAGLFGVGGVLAGIYVGGQQTTAQAQVEHLQWLREQRQEAYVALMEAWETGVQGLKQMVEHWSDHEGDMERNHPDRFFSEFVDVRVQSLWNPIMKPGELFFVIGPEGMEEAVAALTVAFADASDFLRGQSSQPPGADANWQGWGAQLEQLVEARGTLVTAARDMMQTAPAPGK